MSDNEPPNAAAPDAWDSPEAQAAHIAQARALRAQAAKGGLLFETYLPPRLAEWILDLIERGDFADPSEAVFVILGEYRELEPHADLREELLRRSEEAESGDPKPFLFDDALEAQLHDLADTPLPAAAVWQKTP